MNLGKYKNNLLRLKIASKMMLRDGRPRLWVKDVRAKKRFFPALRAMGVQHFWAGTWAHAKWVVL